MTKIPPLAGNVLPKGPKFPTKPPVMAGKVVPNPLPPKTTPKPPVMAGKVIPKPPTNPTQEVPGIVKKAVEYVKQLIYGKK